MSVQFGRWNLNGKPIDTSYFESVKSIISPYGSDGDSEYSSEHIRILYHAFHTTNESRREKQPYSLKSGAIITWDGILNNRAELIRDIGSTLAIDSTDVEIVAAAYDRWGTSCFARLIGDWALAVWDGGARSLIFAKDVIGVRQLYYSIDEEQIVWSTILDPVVLLSGRKFALSEEYIAGWLSFNPAAHLTPYVGVHSVPPSSYVLLRSGERTITKYWDFNPSKRIVYQTDREYEEHFRAVFAEALRCRLRSDSPVLAELSGGMDSSSMVCMADAIVASGPGETPRVDTISYYNDSEPNWNERPYFAKVEEKRGRRGCHVNLSSLEMFEFAFAKSGFEATPARTIGRINAATRQFADLIRSHGTRVVLSGIGGDEVLGGVPTPIPEIQDLLAQLQLGKLAHQLKVWALSKRIPWPHLLADAIRRFLPAAIIRASKSTRPAPWLHLEFVRRNRAALEGYERRVRLLRPLPSFQVNIMGLETLRRQVAAKSPSSDPPYEYRYPYLDRNLLEFAYSIPREQLVRPGQRRSLMRRALVGIVPDEILERRRKAFASHGPRVAISAEWPWLSELIHDMTSSSLGILEKNSFSAYLQNAMNDEKTPVTHLMRTICNEMWLRNLRLHGIAICT
jgi:asparagine synthase (glutamine-hydrolysing)